MDFFCCFGGGDYAQTFRRGGVRIGFKRIRSRFAINLILSEEGLQNVLGGNFVLMRFNLSVLYVF